MSVRPRNTYFCQFSSVSFPFSFHITRPRFRISTSTKPRSSLEKIYPFTQDLRSPSICTEMDHKRYFNEFHFPSEAGFALLDPQSTMGSVYPGYGCVYEIFFKDFGLRFPIPSLILEFFDSLKISITQMCTNFVRSVTLTIVLDKEHGVDRL